MISWPGNSLPAITSAFILAIAAPRLPRLTGIQPMRRAYWPKKGVHISSRFMMNLPRGTAL